MTVRTYTNAEIVWPDGERTKVPQMRVEFREDTPPSGVRARSFSSGLVHMSHEAKIGADDVAKLAALFRCLRAPRVCWKCYDHRTRSHNRRCAWRGWGRRREASEV